MLLCRMLLQPCGVQLLPNLFVPLLAPLPLSFDAADDLAKFPPHSSLLLLLVTSTLRLGR